MRYVLTNAQMRAADGFTINELKVPSLTLMERAGAALAAEAERPADGAAEPVVEAAGTEPPPAAGTEPPAAPDDRSSAEALPEGD